MSDFIWVEKYRPKKIEECILPQGIKDTFLQFLKKGEIPNLLLSGPAGCGKIHSSIFLGLYFSTHIKSLID